MTAAPRSLLRRLARTVAAAPVAVAAVSLLGAWSAPAGAEAPTKVGWWNEANAGAFTPPAPPSVPNGGLYIQNGPGGPMDVSAVEFSVPSGATAGNLTLNIAGSPVLTQPPVACPITGDSFNAAQNGQWAQKPTWDCTKDQVTGTVNPAQTAVTFDASKLSSGSTVAAVILAGGPADQVAFAAPGSDALQVSSPSDQSYPPAADSSASVAPPPSDASGAATPVAPFASGPPAGDAASGTVALPAPSVAAPSAPVAAGSTPLSGSRAGYRTYAPASGGGFPRAGVATGLGLVAMVLALCAYTLGFGPLGGRIQPLSVRGGQRRRPDPA